MNNKIQQGFSRSAVRYDQFSGLHRGIAEGLLARVIKAETPSAILDVGCGTGYLTIKAQEKFPRAKVTGLDFAEGMLEVARLKDNEIEWVNGDGQDLGFADSSFDLVISNLAYQWAEDLKKSFAEARRVLSSNGILACTLFGRNTCQELFQSLDESTGRSLTVARLPDEAQVHQALNLSGFKDPHVECERIQIEFKDIFDLITWLKSIGANNLSREGYLGAGAVLRANTIYQERFPYRQGVMATFEVIKVYVKK